MTMLREVAGRLQAKVKQSTQAINRLHNLLARVFPELATLTDDITARWVLHLLDKYPTAQRIGQARLATLQKIPYLPAELAEQLHLAAQQSVACLSRRRRRDAGPRSGGAGAPHRSTPRNKCGDCSTTPTPICRPRGTSKSSPSPASAWPPPPCSSPKIVDINRFATPDHFVGYFGVFPEENTSGVDKLGKPVAARHPAHVAQGQRPGARTICGTPHASAIVHNPAIRALYRRLRAKGKRGDVALGHCMRKLLHLVYARLENQPSLRREPLPLGTSN